MAIDRSSWTKKLVAASKRVRGLGWTLEERPAEGMVVYLSGAINEHVDLKDVLDALTRATRVVLDMAAIDAITSSGVREWIGFIEELDARCEQLSFERCSFCVVDKLNAIRNFIGRGVVTSVLAPYYCDRCARDQAYLIVLTPGEDANVPDPCPVPCSECGGLINFDDEAQLYLSFHNR